MPLAALAESVAATRTELITQQCKQLHSLIDQQQRRDLVSRTNLGREYESVDKQIDAFAQRVHNNNISSTAYQQLVTQFRDATSQFRDAYVKYDDNVNKLQAINCQDRPADFDLQLTATRGFRDTVEGSVSHAAALLGQYRDMVVELPSQLPVPQTTSGATQ